jgi:hypothetical protein
MRSKLMAVALITILLYMIVGNGIACGPPTTQYDLTIKSTEGGNVATPGEGRHTYDAGEEVDLVATADSGYHFINWTGDVGTIANVNAASTTIIMNGDYTITANFALGTVTYHLTTTSTDGGVVTMPGEATYSYTSGTAVGLVATPDSGYQFVNWTGDVGTIANVNAASTTITMSGDYSISANFERVPAGQFGLTTRSIVGGSVTVPGEGTFAYNAGTVVNLVATPGSGYRFVNWTGDVGTIANVNAASTTVTMNGDYSITANFEALQQQECVDNDRDGYGTGQGCLGPDCDDNNASICPGALDICDGLDNDCDPSSADGSEDPLVGTPCDGPDSDLCKEGVTVCTGGSLTCNDITGGTLDICDGLDNDCDPASPDGSEDPLVGTPCDGPDSDLCKEGVTVCTGGSLTCNDITGGTLEICGDGIDNDCDGSIDEADCQPTGQLLARSGYPVKGLPHITLAQWSTLWLWLMWTPLGMLMLPLLVSP